ncbi:MAG TPA: hypothetical protein VJZ00_14670 [Thermoanaerobaculia bacterium]|nr:hypothetical protein [Thermoanaerobaculia bacterium]
MKTRLLVLSLLLSSAALAQGIDPWRSLSGTAGNPGTTSPWVRTGAGGWTFFHALDAHLTYVSESGPEEQRNEAFSTNWLAAGLLREFGDKGFALVRGRVSLEPYTIADNDGYPQMLQYVSPEAGGVLVDRMRPHDLIGEAAVQVGWRPTRSTMLSVYAAAVGDPALGAPPAEMRASGIDFAEVPFAYDVQELTHDSTSVITASFATRLITLEGSVFHDAVTTGDHTEIDSGDIDSRSFRITLTPGSNIAIQASRAELGEDPVQHTVSTASVTFGSPNVAVTALWTQRENETRDTETAYGFEAALRGARNTFMGRVERVDRPFGFPDLPLPQRPVAVEPSTHFAIGYIFDFIAGSHYRAGAGVNIDYHTQAHDLPDRYGHKPQAIYAFLRFRSN